MELEPQHDGVADLEPDDDAEERDGNEYDSEIGTRNSARTARIARTSSSTCGAFSTGARRCRVCRIVAALAVHRVVTFVVFANARPRQHARPADRDQPTTTHHL